MLEQVLNGPPHWLLQQVDVHQEQFPFVLPHCHPRVPQLYQHFQFVHRGLPLHSANTTELLVEYFDVLHLHHLNPLLRRRHSSFLLQDVPQREPLLQFESLVALTVSVNSLRPIQVPYIAVLLQQGLSSELPLPHFRQLQDCLVDFVDLLHLMIGGLSLQILGILSQSLFYLFLLLLPLLQVIIHNALHLQPPLRHPTSLLRLLPIAYLPSLHLLTHSLRPPLPGSDLTVPKGNL